MMEEQGHCSAKVEMLAGLVQQLLAFSHHSGCSAGWLHVQSVFVCSIYIYIKVFVCKDSFLPLPSKKKRIKHCEPPYTTTLQCMIWTDFLYCLGDASQDLTLRTIVLLKKMYIYDKLRCCYVFLIVFDLSLNFKLFMYIYIYYVDVDGWEC